MSIVYRLWKEVKQLVTKKKLNIWNELVEKVNTDFDENRKEFWAFVGRKSKGKMENITSQRSDIHVYWLVFNTYHREWREGFDVNIFKKGTGRTLLTTGVLPCLVL